MDVRAGVGLTDMGSEAMDYVKVFASIVAANYPERLYRSVFIKQTTMLSASSNLRLVWWST